MARCETLSEKNDTGEPAIDPNELWFYMDPYYGITDKKNSAWVRKMHINKENEIVYTMEWKFIPKSMKPADIVDGWRKPSPEP
ncbi:hypothetical protein CENSYa_0219 [Cenarchaeum symbiosum A]|uniref:Uncharacterized protein n=1 Tax=Cenarchaeum symbiosum (strain A) TaxID=414004 RepID=A0RU45_CENSY|nr:hypothetical protein CENSYa_0219 [Cenarchaeum symbiosum A]